MLCYHDSTLLQREELEARKAAERERRRKERQAKREAEKERRREELGEDYKSDEEEEEPLEEENEEEEEEEEEEEGGEEGKQEEQQAGPSSILAVVQHRDEQNKFWVSVGGHDAGYLYCCSLDGADSSCSDYEPPQALPVPPLAGKDVPLHSVTFK